MKNLMTAIMAMSVLAAISSPAFALKESVDTTKAPAMASAKTKTVKNVKISRKSILKNKNGVVGIKKTK